MSISTPHRESEAPPNSAQETVRFAPVGHRQVPQAAARPRPAPRKSLLKRIARRIVGPSLLQKR